MFFLVEDGTNESAEFFKALAKVEEVFAWQDDGGVINMCHDVGDTAPAIITCVAGLKALFGLETKFLVDWLEDFFKDECGKCWAKGAALCEAFVLSE